MSVHDQTESVFTIRRNPQPGLLRYFDPANLAVLDRVGERPILDRASDGQGLSDHLPLVLDLRIEREPGDG